MQAFFWFGCDPFPRKKIGIIFIETTVIHTKYLSLLSEWGEGGSDSPYFLYVSLYYGLQCFDD